MRIAQVAPLAEPVPPHTYGGTERVVSWLTEELVRRGHDVTLFASGDSLTSAQLLATTPTALRAAGKLSDYMLYVMVQLEQVAERADEFDIIHYHCDYHHFPLSRRCPIPQLTTLHGRLDLPGLPLVFGEFPEMPLISISDAQRRPLPEGNWVQTIYHGLPKTNLRFTPNPEGYLAFLGRICPEKGIQRAVEIAERAGMPLRVAAKVDPADEQYFHEEIEELLQKPHVEFVGEIGDAEKSTFLGNAQAVLFPINWPEPFGLVMIESLACGTPLVAFNHGSVPEILEHGKTAMIVGGVDDAVEAVKQIGQLDRRVCRQEFERRFSVEAMVDGYEAAYEKVAADKRLQLIRPPRRAPLDWNAA